MPEGCGRHVLNVSLFAISQLDLDLDLFPFVADTRTFPAFATRLFWANTGLLSAFFARLWIRFNTLTGPLSTFTANLRFFGFNRLPVPIWIEEMLVRFDEIVNCEVVLSIIEPGSTPNDLFELDDGIDGAHEHNVADISSINPCSQFLRSGQDLSLIHI